MNKIFLSVLLLTASFYAANACDGGDNNWDGPLLEDCGDGKAFYHVESYHSNHYEDRCWSFKCRSVGADTTGCFWSDYVNKFDGTLDFDCPTNYVMNRVSSYHDSYYEDRRWKFNCCKVPGYVTASCSETGYKNNYDGRLSYTAAAGYVFTGMYSVHSNHYE